MSELKRLPVFVFPSSVNFYAEDSSSHKQVVTLYNPYEFLVKFKVLSTAPWKYRIIDPEGSIKPHCCVDIVIRHNLIEPSNFHVTDKFRFQMIEYDSLHILGKKDLVVTLLPGKSNETSTPSQENFKHFSSDMTPIMTDTGALKTHPLETLSKPAQQPGTGSNYIAVCVAVICIIALMLPSSEDKTDSMWSVLHLSSHQKMVFAYSLGLVTMVIFRV